MNGFGLNDVIGLKILKSVGNKQDGTIGDANDNEKDTLMSRTYNMAKSIDDVQAGIDSIKVSVSGNSGNVGFVVDFLCSDDDSKIDWAFRQPDIGNALNQLANLQSDALAACRSVDEIAANATLISLIGGNAYLVSICAKNSTLREKLVPYLSTEDVLCYGYGYSKYSVGDLITLKYHGTDRQFRVVAKDYLLSGKLLLFIEYITETVVWDDGGLNNCTSSKLREFLNTYVLSGFSNKIQNSIATPALPCHNKSNATECYDKIFPLSYTELGLGKNQYAPVEGTAIPYFNSNAKRIRKLRDANGAAQYYWTRTPYTNYPDRAWLVIADGSANYNYVTGGCGVAFALLI